MFPMDTGVWVSSEAATRMEPSPANVQELFTFAFYMSCGDRRVAADEIEALLREHPPAPLAALARRMSEHGRKAETSWDDFETSLGVEVSVPIDVPAERLQRLTARMEQRCLVGGLGCLPVAIRSAFLLAVVFDLGPAEAANILGITIETIRVRLTRAKRRLEAFYGPRCQHLDSDNPCTCVGRLSIALGRGDITEDDEAEPRPDWPRGSRTLPLLYQRLPPPRLTAEEEAALEGAFSGHG